VSNNYLYNFIILLIAVFMLSAISVAESQAECVKTIEITAEEFEFSPTEIKMEPGQPLELTLNNKGAIAHNVTFTDSDIATETIQGGGKTTVTTTFDEPGRYEFICSVPGHANAGMRGVVIVE